MRLWQLSSLGDSGLLNDVELSAPRCTKLSDKSTFWLTRLTTNATSTEQHVMFQVVTNNQLQQKCTLISPT